MDPIIRVAMQAPGPLRATNEPEQIVAKSTVVAETYMVSVDQVDYRSDMLGIAALFGLVGMFAVAYGIVSAIRERF